MKQPLSLVILISGNGSNLQAIIDACHNHLNAEIKAVISNQKEAYGLERASSAGITTHVIPHKDYEDREEFDFALRQQIEAHQPDLIVLAGFMRRLGSAFVQHFYGRLINIHPSLLPKYRGLHTHRRVLEAGDTQHGITIHFVSDDLDGGPIICQAALNVLPNDTEASLKARIQELEHHHYLQVIDWFCKQRISLENDQVAIDGKILPNNGVVL